MATHRTLSCPPAPDPELGLTRAQPLRLDLALPDQLPHRPGVLLMIPGFGQDNDDGYLHAFRAWAADTHNRLALTVGYHGSRNRPAAGAAFQFAQDDAARLYLACQQHHIPWPQPPATPDPNALMAALDAATKQNPPDQPLTLSVGLLPPDGPVNLGFLQALDHLHALTALRQHIDIDPADVVALGSSHGGYLAQLCAKLAPCTFRAVLDNSGYAQLPVRYLDSRGDGQPDCYVGVNPHFRLAGYVASAWSLLAEPDAPNHLHADALALRDLAHPDHLTATRAAAGDRPAVFRCVHAPADAIAPTADKQAWFAAARDAGFDADLHLATPDDVDGAYIKSLDHGLGLSLRRFLSRHLSDLPPLPDTSTTPYADDAAHETTLDFAGPTRVYRVRHHADRSPTVTVDLKRS
ncbi:MAG: DUF2920 family protein [Planctomycetota bacterium]